MNQLREVVPRTQAQAIGSAILILLYGEAWLNTASRGAYKTTPFKTTVGPNGLDCRREAIEAFYKEVP